MKQTILVADDDPGYGSMVQEALEDAGFEAVLLTEAMKVLPAIRERDYDLVILDLAMPGLNGLELARGLAKSGSAIPVAALTGHDTPETRSEAATAGIALFLTKNTGIEDIVSSVRELLGA